MRWLRWVSASALLTVIACEEQGPPPDWVSDNPGFFEPGLPLFASKEAGAVDDDDGMRAVLEADIVTLEGDRIYALSPYGGLAVVDASQPDDLELLGRWRAFAQPFEMYVDEGRVFAMLTDYGTNVWDEDTETWQWRVTSRLVALDASDPDAIDEIGEFELPGWIQDSRRVGDVIYVVTQEQDACFDCRAANDTIITSIDVSDPTKPVRRDQIVLEDEREGWGFGGPRTVTSTDERLYVAALRSEDWETGRSTIEVIDIADPSGDLERGASVEVAGTIQDRWQMDEHEGVLRVVSQPQFWGSGAPPVIETFAIASSAMIEPLGSTTLSLPRPESLQSVRFDGTRAYAVTFEQVDPLFTLDLSDPRQPRQVGELEIPGWVEHIEPRGDRLLALGFIPNDPRGALTVSLFNVADLERPGLLSRVYFGGTWAELAEDPDRLHKAFAILDELDLVLVPFSGWTDQGPCPGAWESGIQLVSWNDDELELRGMAPSHGRARRALVHRGRMIAMSDKALETFSIEDRDHPVRTDQLALAVSVNEVAVGGGHVVRLSHDWWTNEATLEVVSVTDAEAVEALGRVPLGDVLGDACGLGWWGAELFVYDGHAYLVVDATTDATAAAPTRLAVFDVRDATAPRWVTTLDLPFARGFIPYFPGDLGTADDTVVQVGKAMVFVRHDVDPRGGGAVPSRSSFEIVDLSRPQAPHYVGRVERPAAMVHAGLAVHDGVITSWHVQPASPDGRRVRYFFERLYANDPARAWAAAPINVPGIAVAWDQRTERVVTIDSTIVAQSLAQEEECWARPQARGWEEASSTCQLLQRPVHLLQVEGVGAQRLDTLDVEHDGRLMAARVGDDRLFAHVSRSPWVQIGPQPSTMATDELAVVTGLSDTALVEAARPSLPPGAWGWLGLIEAYGKRLLTTLQAGLGEIDATIATAPMLEVHPLYGYGCLDLAVVNDTAYCALGDPGLQVVPLGATEPSGAEALLRWLAILVALLVGLGAVLYVFRSRPTQSID